MILSWGLFLITFIRSILLNFICNYLNRLIFIVLGSLLSASFVAFTISDFSFFVSFFIYFFYSGIFQYPYILKISFYKERSYFAQKIFINTQKFVNIYVIKLWILYFLLTSIKKITSGVLKDSFKFSSVLSEYSTKTF